MFKPRFATSHTLVPILSKDTINDIGEKLVEDFCPQAMTTPTEIDVDRFITQYLGLEQDFQYLSHCGVFLGMTVFNDTDRVPVFNPDRWEAKYICAFISIKDATQRNFTECLPHGVQLPPS